LPAIKDHLAIGSKGELERSSKNSFNVVEQRSIARSRWSTASVGLRACNWKMAAGIWMTHASRREVKVDSFFGAKAGPFRSDDPKLNGKPSRRVYLRVYFAGEGDQVMVGRDVSATEASGLRQGSRVTVLRTVSEVTVDKNDPWFSGSPYTGVVDALEPYCVTITVVRK
jgi:hypothetical protein